LACSILIFEQSLPFGNASTFVLVRHPYARAVSEYYCPFSGYKDISSAKHMNMWLQEKLKTGFEKKTSFLPQSLSVYDGDKRMVDYILHFETLESDFCRLMSQFGLEGKVKLP
jgi:hypothetical protein